MTIISMFLVGILILLNLEGFKSMIKLPKKAADDEMKQKFKLIGNSAGCLDFTIYFVCLIIPAFVIDNKYVVLSIVLVLLAELIEMFSRISKTNNSNNYDEMWEKILKERRNFKFIFVEICELIIFISIFVQLFQQL